MPDLLWCVTTGAKILTLAWAIAYTVTIGGRLIARKEGLPSLMVYLYGLSVALFVGLMRWLD